MTETKYRCKRTQNAMNAFKGLFENDEDLLAFRLAHPIYVHDNPMNAFVSTFDFNNVGIPGSMFDVGVTVPHSYDGYPARVYYDGSAEWYENGRMTKRLVGPRFYSIRDNRKTSGKGLPVTRELMQKLLKAVADL